MIDVMNDEVVEMFEALLPPHAASLNLIHNQHLNYYSTVEAEEDNADAMGNPWFWVSEEQRAKARETNDVWELVWHPNTPVGSCAVHAADLDVLMAYVKANET